VVAEEHVIGPPDLRRFDFAVARRLNESGHDLVDLGPGVISMTMVTEDGDEITCRDGWGRILWTEHTGPVFKHAQVALQPLRVNALSQLRTFEAYALTIWSWQWTIEFLELTLDPFGAGRTHPVGPNGDHYLVARGRNGFV
jgi:hypothetical protein